MLGIASYINRTNRKFRNFIRKKTFFFTVTLSIGHIFFEYDWFCTPPFISIVFNTILTTVLTRSIASFFSNNGEIKSIHKHMEEKDKVFAQIQPKDIAKVKHFYYKRDDKLEKYSVDPTIVDGHICVYIKDKDDKDHGTKRYRYYFYVAFDGESVYLIDLDLGPIDKNDKEEIRHKINNLMVGGCMDHYCEKIEQKKRDFIINNDKEEKEIKGLVLVNMLETGFLNYIIYSHRSNTDEKEINKNNSTTDNDKSKNDFIIALRINFIIALILTLCALCALYALFVFNNECYYIIIIMAICGLFAVFVLFKLSDDKDDKGDKDAKDDEKLASPV